MGKYVSYFIFRIFIGIFWLVPFPVLYAISDGLAWLLKDVIKYRRSTIESNLNRVFGKQDNKDRRTLVKKIYQNLADISLEGIKGISLSLKSMTARHVISNPSLLTDLLTKHDDIIIVAAHYNNWEWSIGSMANLNIAEIIGVYKKISNPLIDQYLVKKRSKWGIFMIPTKKTREILLREKKHQSIILLAADQSPSNVNRAIWVDFLGQKTACIHGPEMYARLLKAPTVYGHCTRTKRGRYRVDFELLAEAGTLNNAGELTQKYMQTVERVLLNKPENWLWSHKRWKHDYQKSL